MLHRYLGEIGDLVIGRIAAVESKRWKCDINGQKDAVLQLASVNLPGGVQRMRTYEDQLQMRSLYTEYDLISVMRSLILSPFNSHHRLRPRFRTLPLMALPLSTREV
jgi:hypothetical protein